MDDTIDIDAIGVGINIIYIIRTIGYAGYISDPGRP